jgi:hypothetical protein
VGALLLGATDTAFSPLRQSVRPFPSGVAGNGVLFPCSERNTPQRRQFPVSSYTAATKVKVEITYLELPGEQRACSRLRPSGAYQVNLLYSHSM